MAPDSPRLPVELTRSQSRVLEAWAGGPSTPQALALRARIVLACAEARANEHVAATLGVTAQTVAKWRGRFEQYGIEGLRDAHRSGAPRRIEIEDLETRNGTFVNGTPIQTQSLQPGDKIRIADVDMVYEK